MLMAHSSRRQLRQRLRGSRSDAGYLRCTPAMLCSRTHTPLHPERMSEMSKLATVIAALLAS